MRKWFNKYESTLPLHSGSIIKLSDSKIRQYSQMLDELMNIPASINKNGVIKRVGSVGAAKALFALRKNYFPPWDNPISDDLSYSKNGKGYTDYMIYVKGQILQLKVECDKLNIELKNIPNRLKRPNVTLEKLIDEYLWITITRGFDPKVIIGLSEVMQQE